MALIKSLRPQSLVSKTKPREDPVLVRLLNTSYMEEKIVRGESRASFYSPLYHNEPSLSSYLTSSLPYPASVKGADSDT